jgi:hypothetical protein
MAEDKKPFERLPTNVVPRNYKVELTPDLKAFTFKGVLDVTAEVSDISVSGASMLSKSPSGNPLARQWIS